MKWLGHEETDRADYQGGSDASVETFKGDPTNSLIRESFQNSVDQWSDKTKPVKIIINYNRVSKKDLFFESYEKILKAMKKNAKDEEDEAAIPIFENIFKGLRGEKIPILEIADYNTNGALGKDIKEPGIRNPWIALTRREGYSVKPDTSSIGNFGIGKNALVNISDSRTVIYTTIAENEDKWKMMGKCKLIHWFDENNEFHKNKIFLGKKDENNNVISLSEEDKNKINKIFHRDEYGASTYILQPNMPNKWKEKFLKTILRNYWLMIERNQVEVEIHSHGSLDIKINNKNIEELMEKTFKDYNSREVKQDHPLFGNPLEFYKVYKNTDPIKTKIDHIGEIELYFKSFSSSENIPPAAGQRRISYVRGNMLIQNKRISTNGEFLGIMMCNNKAGNIVLKEMEPPKHDKFEYNNLRDTNVKDIKGNKVTTEVGKEILKQIRKFITDVAEKEENKRLSNETLELVGLDEWNLELGDEELEDNKETSRRIIKDISSKKLKKTRLNPEFGGDDKARKEFGDDPNIQPDPKPKPPSPEPNPKPRGGKLIKDENGEFIIPANYFKPKSFITKSTKNTNRYKVIIDGGNADNEIDLKSIKSEIEIKQNGDKKTSCAFKIENAFYEDNNEKINFDTIETNSGIVKGYQLNKILVPSILYIDIIEPYKSNLNFKIKII